MVATTVNTNTQSGAVMTSCELKIPMKDLGFREHVSLLSASKIQNLYSMSIK